MSEEVKKEQMDAFEAYSEAGGRTDHIKVVADPVEAAKDLTEREFEGWGVNSEMPGGQGVGQDWSGIIGSTQDGMPWIGRVPELEGQFPAVAKLVLDPTKAFHETGLPGVFEITAARMSSLQHKGKL
ncbi:hypothetical protein MNV49_007461 [Pseudohyphozyma bogoriensis]|nr:hypothetical protein MNV49_007461 [Pseudohyphozyma bogoriensis]